MADPRILKYLAVKTGLGVNYLSKDEKISLLLEQLRSLFPEVILKGGTALSRVHLLKTGMGRFSEDIDLDISMDTSLDEKISYIKDGIKGIEGFDIDEMRLVHRTLRFDCRYTNEFGQRDKVQIEFYLTGTRFLSAEDVLVRSPFMDSHPTIFRVYSLEDLMARKFIALYNRTEGKDIYDIYYSLELDFDRLSFFRALDMMIEFYNMDSSMFFDKLLDKLGETVKNAYYIGNSTNHYLPMDHRPDWASFIEGLRHKIERIPSRR